MTSYATDTQNSAVFPGFSVQDFDAYVPKKWQSNIFTRERLEVRQKLLAIGKALAGKLIGSDGSPLAFETSVEYPALWNHKQVQSQNLYFFRNEQARRELDAILNRQKPLAALIEDPSPHKNHPFLCVTVVEQGLRLDLQVHPEADVDRRSLEKKIGDYFEKERLLNLIAGLGAEHRIGTVQSEGDECSSVDMAKLDALLEQVLAAKRPLFVGLLFARGDDRLVTSDFLAIVESSLERLLPVYRFVAWSRDNDFLSMRETLRQEKEAKRQKYLAKNDRVRIIRGMFSGKTGVVQDLDAKGNLKVLVGKMSVKVDSEDVVRA